MLMSPDSSSSEVDPRPITTINHTPIQMIQVPECTQSHGGVVLKLQHHHQPIQQQQQQQHHVIHVDYSKKINDGGLTKINNHHPTVFHQKPTNPMVQQQQQQKTDEELNLEFDGTNVLCRVCGDKASGFHYGK
ncbi:hypothetical protein PVAND_015395 [Polypedilum vanderplanki]|uniref:Uncharacterized protein n=1 Tax=Polypedilum vanderplanki TaxID=319348 RepID=A0A9J6BCX4_POLVA|nr:hypothetical protein PVAND_015395 [Polypedilum vanderplanki]